MFICLCKGLTESQVREVAQEVNGDRDALNWILGWEDDDCCGRCAKNSCTLAKVYSEPSLVMPDN